MSKKKIIATLKMLEDRQKKLVVMAKRLGETIKELRKEADKEEKHKFFKIW